MKTSLPEKSITNPLNVVNNIFNDVFNGIAVLDLNKNCLNVNDGLSEMLGYSKRELCNMNMSAIMFTEDLELHKENYDRLITGEISKYQIEQRYFHKSGSIVWMLVSVVYSENSYKGSSRTIWQFTDISKTKKIFNKTQTMLNVVREKNDRLTSFTEIINHDLRSHSSNLSTLTNFLEEDYPWMHQNESFSMLKKAVQNLSHTLDHLNEVAKIKEVKSTEIRALNLFDFVEKAIYNIAALAKNTSSTIVNEIDKNFYVKGIPAYLDSIILNFLTNAIKYRSEHRKPEIILTSSIQSDFVVFSIKDNGLGIDLDKYGDKLFHMYKTFHCNDDARGIGLFITKNHIESLGGKVIVTSKVDEGSEFSVFLKRG